MVSITSAGEPAAPFSRSSSVARPMRPARRPISSSFSPQHTTSAAEYTRSSGSRSIFSHAARTRPTCWR
jgi:hypothetical protein